MTTAVRFRVSGSALRLGLLVAGFATLGAGCVRPPASPSPLAPPRPREIALPPSPPGRKDVNLGTLPGAAAAFAVTLSIPASWEVESVPGIEAMNLYDPASLGDAPREKSQVFVRHFRASDFLALSTVTIHERTPTVVAGRPAVAYVIEKKPGVPPFPDQPAWRNVRHRVTDVRLSDASPSEFLVVAKNPVLPDDVFTRVLSSLRPSGGADTSTVVLPTRGFFSAITKKPFGIFVTPENSPISPERFRGFHTAADAELPADTPVFAIADGVVIQSGRVSGYGGFVAIEHQRGSERFVSIYGHLDPARLPAQGVRIRAGEEIGVLGAAFSAETDGERAHLHFGMFIGSGLDVAGYVSSRDALARWRDPVAFLRAENAREP